MNSREDFELEHMRTITIVDSTGREFVAGPMPNRTFESMQGHITTAVCCSTEMTMGEFEVLGAGSMCNDLIARIKSAYPEVNIHQTK